MRRLSTTRKLIEKAYGLEEGSLEGMSMKKIYEALNEEEGALDRFRYVDEDEEEEDK